MRFSTRSKTEAPFPIIALIVLAMLAGTLLIFDLFRPPDEQITAKIALKMISLYRKYGSGVASKLGGRCKFTPTCSEYAAEAIEKYGILEGGWMATKRLARCTPWSKSSGYDPVP